MSLFNDEGIHIRESERSDISNTARETWWQDDIINGLLWCRFVVDAITYFCMLNIIIRAAGEDGWSRCSFKSQWIPKVGQVRVRAWWGTAASNVLYAPRTRERVTLICLCLLTSGCAFFKLVGRIIIQEIQGLREAIRRSKRFSSTFVLMLDS